MSDDFNALKRDEVKIGKNTLKFILFTLIPNLRS